MAFIKVGKQWLDDIYAENVVKPNEFKQIVSNLVDKEISLRQSLPQQAVIVDKGFWSRIRGKATEQIKQDESYYFNLSPNSPNLLQAIIDIAYNQPDKLLLSTEESKSLIFAEGFRNKSFIIRECSDLMKSPYLEEEFIYIDKKTAWAADYLTKHATTGRVLIAKLHAKEI